MKKSWFFMGCCGVVCALLAGCGTVPQDKQKDAPPPVSTEPVRPVDPTVVAEQALTQGLTIYAEGRYEEAIAALAPLTTAPELPLSSQVKALKFTAFSHCAMGQLRPCRQSFDRALELDPTFQLTEAEKGHPVWGKEFNAARIASRSKRMVRPNS